jgi:hypothetical protein
MSYSSPGHGILHEILLVPNELCERGAVGEELGEAIALHLTEQCSLSSLDADPDAGILHDTLSDQLCDGRTGFQHAS